MRPVKEIKIGTKVIRGPDWKWGKQDKNSDYGIIKRQAIEFDSDNSWVAVHWYKDGECIDDSHNYRVGPINFDLAYYDKECDYDKTYSLIDKLIEKYEKL